MAISNDLRHQTHRHHTNLQSTACPWYRVEGLVAFLLFLLLSAPALAITPVQTYYVPIEESDIQPTLDTLSQTGAGNNIETVVSIAIGFDGTVIHYDHAEDGYEAALANAPTQGTTRIWGDGNGANGTAPGFPDDLLDAGDVVVLQNTVPLPRIETDILFDAADKFVTNAPVAVTRAAWALDPGTVLAGAVEVYPTNQWGLQFESPIGEDMAIEDDEIFELVTASYMASEDGTSVDIDTDCDGVEDDLTVNLDEGDSFFVPLAETLCVGSSATSNKRVQLHAITGDIGALWESRWAIVFPSNLWSSEYFVPVSTRTSNTTDPTHVFLYNPNPSAIDVSWATQNGPQLPAISVPAGGNARQEIPNDTGARFFTENDETFYAIVAVDADRDDIQDGGDGTDEDSDENNRDFDWGFASVPDNLLSSQVLVGFAPGIDPNSCGPGEPFNCLAETAPGVRGSPVWVMSTESSAGQRLIFVDYDADPATGSHMNSPDAFGFGYDEEIILNALQRAKIFDPNDNDMTGALIYSADGSSIAVAWGQDPESSVRTNPYFDAGTVIPPLPSFTIEKEVNEELVAPGAELAYTITITNTSRAPLPSVLLSDELPPHVTYVEKSSKLGGLMFDDAGATPFPLDEGGATLPGPLQPGTSFVFTFDVTVNEAVPINEDEVGDCEDPQTRLLNEATATAVNFTASDDALTCVEFNPDIDIRKQVEGPDTRTFISGSDVTFEIVVTNTGMTALQNVVVTDIVSPQCNNVIGALAVDESVTYECTVPIVTEGFVNEACVAGEAFGEPVADCDPSTVEIIDIDIRKQAEGPDSRTFPSGSDVTFEIVVTNTGTSDLQNVMVTDVLTPDCDRNIGDLAAEASFAYNCMAPAVTESFENEVCVEGGADGLTVEDCDPSTVEIIDIDIRKQEEGPDSRTFPSGSDVTFEIVVTNTGPEDLVNVEVTDIEASQCDNIIGNLAAGDSVTYECTVPNVTEGFTNVAKVTGERDGEMVMDDDPSTVEIEQGGGQGCTPGYWKQPHHFDSWVGYVPNQPFSSVFDNAFPNKTLLDVLKQGGGGLKALGRHTVAALLNSANPDVSYDVADVIAQFNAVYPGTKREYNALKNEFEGFNEQGCPLN